MDWDTLSNGCMAKMPITDAVGQVIGYDKVATLQCIPTIFQLIVRGDLEFAGITALAMIILSGIRLINSGGNPVQVAKARKTLAYAILGFILILVSFTIVNLIAYTIAARCITTFGFESCP